MKNLVFLPFILILVGCKINQKIKNENKALVNHGRWVEKDVEKEGVYISKGYYDRGEKVGTWKMSLNGKRYYKEVFMKDSSEVKFYHPNGKLMELGKTKTIIGEDIRHWQKVGVWKFFDVNGKLTKTQKFAEGKMVEEIEISKK